MHTDRALSALDTCATRSARSAVLLAGWLWLGFQGERLGWSLASGLGVVALWWALRLLLGHRFGRWTPPHRRTWTCAMGLGTGLGVLLVEHGALGRIGLPVLLATAVTWALWCAALTPGANRRPPREAADPPSATALAARVLPTTAMGLMMGSMWLSGQWCATAGWSPASMVLLHVALMALLPLLLQAPAQALHTHAVWRDALPLALLALGGGCALLSGTAGGAMLGMALQVLAWALCPRAADPRPQNGTAQAARLWRAASQASVGALALGGPLLLLLVGWLSPTAGPAALHGAQALLGALALAALLPSLWRLGRHTRPLSTALSTHLDTP